MIPTHKTTTVTQANASALRATAAIFLILCPLFIITRCWALHFLEKRELGKSKARLHADSWWLVATMPVSCAGMVIIIITTHYGFGTHASDLIFLPNGTQHLQHALFLFYVDQILYSVVMGMTKIAILCFYIRIFPAKKFVLVCRFWLWFMVIYTAVSASISAVHCVPVELAWRGTVELQEKQCMDFAKLWYSRAAINAFTDVVIAVLPIPVICRLKMSMAKKISICGMFLLGLIVVLIAILRATTIEAAAVHSDPTWNGVTFCIYSMIEDGLGIIIACLPPIPKALALRFPSVCSWLSGKVTTCRREKCVSSSQDSLTEILKSSKILNASDWAAEKNGDGQA